MIRDIEIVTVCPWCGEAHKVMVDLEGFMAWNGGELVQNAFPYLDADEREMLISGICPKCWGDTFGEAEEEDFEEDWEDLEEGFDPYEGCYTYDC